MRILTVVTVAVLGGGVALAPAVARAASVDIAAGQEYTLTGDIVLSDSDNFTAGAASGARCKIHGAGFSISSPDTWTGNFTMRNCDVDGLGVMGGNAIGLSLGGALEISGSTFSTSSKIEILLRGAASVAFTGNTLAEDSVIRNEMMSLDMSQDAFHAKGGSTGTKVFQGNIVRKGRIHFELTDSWLIGGDTPAEGNILVGLRAGTFIDRCGAMTIRGNYSHAMGLGWNQVKNISVFSTEGNTLIEHNVLIGVAWNTEVHGPGEIRYNLIVNPVERAWVQVWATGNTKVHHNLLMQTADNQFKEIAGGFVVFPDDPPLNPPLPPTTEIYNNTFDGGGVCNPGLGGALSTGAILASLRSNAFVNIRLPPWTGIGLVGAREETVMDPLPTLFAYADYNLFHNPDASVKANYTAGVAGKTVRVDPGFAYNDIPVGGAVNAQVDPRFAGPIPHRIPFDEQSVIDRQTTACHILAFYRKAYAPGASSPLTDAGDPADGAGNDIGAIGAGTDNALDRFAKLCDPNDVGPIAPAADVYNCPAVSLEGGGGGGPDPIPPNHRFVCVCEVGAGAPSYPEIGVLTLLAVVTLGRRRRR